MGFENLRARKFSMVWSKFRLRYEAKIGAVKQTNSIEHHPKVLFHTKINRYFVLFVYNS